MITTKQSYITPTVDVFSVKCNRPLMASDFTLNSPQEGNTNWWNDEEGE